MLHSELHKLLTIVYYCIFEKTEFGWQDACQSIGICFFRKIRQIGNHCERLRRIFQTKNDHADCMYLLISRRDRFSRRPSSPGICPVKRLYPRDRFVKSASLPSSDGMVPDSRPICKSRSFRLLSWPILVDRVPVRKFDPSATRCKLFKEKNPPGISPFKELVRRSINSSSLSELSSEGMVPVKKLAWR